MLDKFIHLLLHVFGFSKGGLDFVPERDAGHVNSFLRQVTDGAVLGFSDFSTTGLDDAGDALHQGGFPRSVMAGEGNTLLWHDGECQVLKENSGPEFYA